LKYSRIYLYTIIAFITISNFTLPQKASQKWLEFNEWNGSFTVERSFTTNATQGDVMESIKFYESSRGTFRLYEKYFEAYLSEEGNTVMNFADWTGDCEATSELRVTRTLSVGDVSFTEELSGIGSAKYGLGESGAGLSIDISTGTYSVGYCYGDVDMEYKRKVDESTEAAIEGMENKVVRDYFISLINGLENQNYETGLAAGIGILSGNQSVLNNILSYIDLAQNRDEPKLPKNPTTLTGEEFDEISNTKMSWRVSPGKKEEVEYFLAVSDEAEYSNYLPDPEKYLAFKIYSKSKNPMPVTVKVKLTDVSTEPGTCLNSKDHNNNKPDLSFDLENSSTRFYLVDSTTAQSIEEVTSAEISILAKDYGAFGKLSAEIFYDGKWQSIKTEDNKTEIKIPEDENDNFIADKWEKDNGIYGKNLRSNNDDEDKPKLDGLNGDGLSVYEEYRGVISKGQHKRLDPKFKDLIIENNIGDIISGGLQLFESASKIKVTELKNGEMPQDRIVNYNNQTGHKMDQYGIIINRKGGGGGDHIQGEALPDNIFHKTPKICKVINIFDAALNFDYEAEIDSQDREQASEEEYIRMKGLSINITVAHEIGHSVGAEHHATKRNSKEITISFEIPERHKNVYKVYDISGNEITTYPISILQPISYDHGPASGDVNCIMCYTNLFLWVRRDTNIETYWRIKPLPITTKFCNSPLATGINKTNNGFSDAIDGAGNCLKQMRVKDIAR